MPSFEWKGRTRAGLNQEGILLADSRDAAIAVLEKHNVPCAPVLSVAAMMLCASTVLAQSATQTCKSTGVIPLTGTEPAAKIVGAEVREAGAWLRVNGEAIYGTRRWTVPHEGPMVESLNPRLDKTWKWTETTQRPLVHYTRKGNAVYAICLAWPGTSRVSKRYAESRAHARSAGSVF